MSITNVSRPGETPQTGDYVTDGKKIWPYTEPFVATPQPKDLSSADWQEYAYTVLGAVALPSGTAAEQQAAGFARYGAILIAARALTSNAGVVAALEQYDRASSFRKDKVTVFLGVLNGTDPKVVTDAEFAAIIGNWPT